MNDDIMQITKEGISLTENRRILWLDALKGYGILVVMLSHLYIPLQNIYFLYAGFMPIFYLASGYVDHKECTKKTIFNKAKRLLIPYMTYGAVMLMLYELIGGGKINATEWLGLAYARYCLYPYGMPNNVELLTMEATATLWFLPSLFIGMTLYYFLFVRFLQNRFILAFNVVLCLVFTIALNNLPILLPWSFDIAFLVAVFIYLGHQIRRVENIKHPILILCCVFSLLIYGMIVYANGETNLSVRIYGNHGWKSVLAYIVLGVAYFIGIASSFRQAPIFVQKVFAFIGTMSLRLMCVHIFIFYVADLFMPYCAWPLAILSRILLAVLCAWLIGIVFHKSGNKFACKYL